MNREKNGVDENINYEKQITVSRFTKKTPPAAVCWKNLVFLLN